MTTRARGLSSTSLMTTSYDAVWFARGGYGSCRMVEAVVGRLTEPSRRKAYLGYSDAGVLLAALYRAGFEAVAHGPVAQDILRDGGDAAVSRAVGGAVLIGLGVRDVLACASNCGEADRRSHEHEDDLGSDRTAQPDAINSGNCAALGSTVRLVT